jgi:hypothetical protein
VGSPTIEDQFEISLADEVSWILGGLQVSDEIAAARERLLAEFDYVAQMAENRIAYRHSG